MAKTIQFAVLSDTARSAISGEYSVVLQEHLSSGNLITRVCTTINKYAKGRVLSDDDCDVITGEIAKARKWEGTSAKMRRSECKIVLKTAHVLPEAVEMYRAKKGHAQFHECMKIARKLREGLSVKESVNFALKPPAREIVHSRRVAKALQAWGKAESHRVATIEKAAKILGLERFKIKLEETETADEE
jgi:hypothetical protein